MLSLRLPVTPCSGDRYSGFDSALNRNVDAKGNIWVFERSGANSAIVAADPTAAKTQAEKTVAPQIQQTLIQNKKNAVMTAWIAKIAKSYCQSKKISYQAGYAPSPDPCAQYTTSSTSTTG